MRFKGIKINKDFETNYKLTNLYNILKCRPKIIILL